MVNEFLSDSLLNDGKFAFNTFVHMGEMKLKKKTTLYF